MLRFVRLAHLFPSRSNCAGLFLLLAALAVVPSARAQFSAPSPGIQVHDTSALHPPPGARVAIVEFMDMECPVCATTNPILETAAAKYKIPLVRHDFLIPYHAWSPIAAVNARWFDTKSKALGDEYVLAHDPVQAYNRFEALKVGRLLDELDYLWFEDPIRTTDLEGLVELAKALDVPLHVGEFLASISDFAEYIRLGAVDVVRLIADNVGGISGSMRVGLLADAFGLECTPHNWGNVLDLAVHFHLELALPNAYWFEMPHPAEYADRPYHKDKFRIDKDGYIAAPAAPGLGYPLDRDALDKMIKRIDV